MNLPSIALSYDETSMSKAAPASSRRGVRVLIVDDSRSFGLAARQLLEHRGCSVIGEACSAADAVDAVEREPPDAVLLDLCLPDTNGSVLAAFLHARYPAVAVLLTSAEEVADGSRLVQDTGARGFVNKRDLANVDLMSYFSTGCL